MTRKPRLVVLPPQHLGHEIHVGRNIVVDMFSKGILDPDCGDCVITGLPDRRFFYEGLFGADRVFDFSQVPGIILPIRPPKDDSDYFSVPSSLFNLIDGLSDHQILNLTSYANPPTYCNYETSEELRNVGYDFPSKYWNDHYLHFAKKFNFTDKRELDFIIKSDISVFIIIHHRYNAPMDRLLLILDSLPANLAKVIFTQNSDVNNVQLNRFENLLFTNDLKTYASLLNDYRCKLLISEWSGGGQVAQYTLGPQGAVWYYYDYYRDIYNFVATHKIWELNSTLGSYFNCWDFKLVSGCSTKHFATFDNMLPAILGIRVS